MRERQEIKKEIDAVQESLEHNIAELKDVITDKVDIRSKVQDKVEEKKTQAMDTVVRVRRTLLDSYAQARQFVRDKPWVLAGIGGGVLLVGGALFAIRSRMRREQRRGELRSFDDLLLALEDRLQRHASA